MSKSITTQRERMLNESTRKVIARMIATAIGDVVTWAELKAITGRTRQTVQSMVREAKDLLQDEEKMHFRTRVSVGVERIAHADVVHDDVPAQRHRIGAAAGRMLRTTRNVSVDGMSKDDRDHLFANQTVAAMTVTTCANESLACLRASMSDCKAAAPFSPQEAAARLFSY